LLFFDERSTISQIVIGTAESNVSETAHDGGHELEDWGGLPIIVAFGDDYQLPLPGLGGIYSLTNQGGNQISHNGAQQFINLGRNTMELKTIMRQDKDQTQQREMLKISELATQQKLTKIYYCHYI
jgi:hypothetical protein